MKKKTERKKLTEKLDKLISLRIREIEPECVTCGSTTKLGAGHIFSKRGLNTRWDLTEAGNVHTQCWGCNYRHIRDQYPYFTWYIEKFGLDQFNSLRRVFKTVIKLKDAELKELITLMSTTHG